MAYNDLFPFAPTTSITVTDFNGKVIYSGMEMWCPQKYRKLYTHALISAQTTSTVDAAGTATVPLVGAY